nr:type I polyketide synthase [Nocardia altamirensis]
MTTEANELVEALRSALKDNDRLRKQNRQMLAKASEPIAVVGMSCRFPGGAASPAQLWDLLADGRDAMVPLPDNRGWDVDGLYNPDPDHPGTTYATKGGFIDDVADFDADFFGIGPREALAMDPQQRLILEAAWEAFEDAAIDPTALRGSDTGIYCGAISSDYGRTMPPELAGYRLGVLTSVLAGRISYLLGLEGPAVTVDTACSSSLVAMHLAARALRAGECSLALAGGVTVLSSPILLTEFSRQRGLAADGRCKSYAAAADGTGFADGAGVVVLERLSDAQRNGHRILAVLRGSAINQDGASNGLTAPSGPAQERVIRAALADAGLSAADVDAVEGHGTGTQLGDPIEAHALLATYGRDRTGDPLWLGSIKSNIGHTSAAAGIAGVIKMVLAMRHSTLPPTLHVDAPSPQVDWASGTVALLRAAQPWPAHERPRRAAVSSFGVSGTNAHVILEEAPAAVPAAPTASPVAAVRMPAPVLVSAQGASGLRAQAERLRDLVQADPELSPLDLGFSLTTSRALLPHRAMVLAPDRDALLSGLAEVAAAAPGVLEGRAVAGKTAVMFTGQGAQRARMGAELAAALPRFDAALAEVCAVVDPLLGRSLRELLAAEPDSPDAALLNATEYTQVALFAVEVALFRLVESFGVRVDYLIGHSVGEIAAAHVAGVLSLADAAALVVARGRLMGALPAGGAMVAVQADEAEVLASLAGFDGRLAIAAVNAPRAVVVSGDADAAEDWLPQWSGRKTARLRVSHAFHSPRMEPMLAEFETVTRGLTFQQPRIPIVSNVRGTVVSDELTDPMYWVGHVRAAVRFGDGVRTLYQHGVRRFLELGPDAVLTAMARQTLDELEGDEPEAVLIAAARAERDEVATFAGFLGQARMAGLGIDWAACYAGTGATRVDLPTYAFQRRRFWLAPDTTAAAALPVDDPVLTAITAAPTGVDTGAHPLAAELLAAAEADRQRIAREFVLDQVAAVLGHDGHAAIEATRALKDIGLDSMSAVELRNRLNRGTGLRLTSTTAFDYPTPAALARLIVEQLTGAATTRRQTRKRAAPDEPLAIIGMSCRYPGEVHSPDALWDFVAAGGDGMTGFPDDRDWDLERLYHPDPDNPGTTYAKLGGFVTGAGDFDAEFFGISPHEALAMDPQQRWLLEGAWEALEHAGIDPTALHGSDTGVYCGAVNPDYGTVMPSELERFHLTGVMSSVLSGRISYLLGLEGPALTVDTACSASLVALHLAAQALRAGECSLALAGGVTVMSTPVALSDTARLRGLSEDGRCKAFAAAADGTSFADGMGLLVLERLSDARRNGHRVLAVLRGSAVNQDGATNGLTAPNGPSQERVIRAALDAAGLRAADVDVVEAHGTGTRLGDPIEAHALLATYGQERERGPLWLGSIKSNIGHAGPAAGVAGVIKMVQAMRHEVLPRTLHVDEPSPHIDWDAGEVELLTEEQPWKTNGHPRRAAVSGFGMSGTNAHVILEEAPAPYPVPEVTGRKLPAVPVLISARTPAALQAQADRLRGYLLAHPGLDPVDVGFASATTRAALSRRAAVVARDRDELISGLAALATAEPAEHTIDGKAVPGKTVFVFPGHGSQWTEMAVRLLDTAPAFAAEIAACARAFEPHVDWRLEEVLRSAPGAPSMDVVDGVIPVNVLQPVVFAVMVSLAALWRAHGVEPDAVVGHSQGEVAAAYVSGALSLEDAALIVVMRNRIAHDLLPNDAGLLWIGASVAAAEERIAPRGAAVAVAVVNSPTSLVVAGDTSVLVQLQAECERDGVRTRALGSAFASHTSAVEVLETELLASLTSVAPRANRVPFYSTALDTYVDGTDLGAPYWYANLRQRVGFEPAVRALIDDGATCFVEVSPHPVLTTAIEQTAHAHGAEGRIATVGTLRREEGGLDRFALALASAHTVGVPVDWPGFYAETGAVDVPLPTYAFQRRRYWLPPVTSGSGAGQAILAAALPTAADAAEDGSLVRRLAAVPEEERETVLQDVIRAQVAAVLGHESADSVELDLEFREMGFTSVSAVALRNRLQRVTGVSLPPTVVFDHPDTLGIARWLAGQLSDHVAVAEPDEVGEAAEQIDTAPREFAPANDRGTITALIRHAHRAGDIERALPWLLEASRFLPSFTEPMADGTEIVRLAKGDATQPAVVCVPSFVVGSGPHLFLSLAAELSGRDVFACSLPGFRDGEAMPASWDVAIAVLADAIRTAVGDGDFVLVGYSIGGAIAHALAAEFERTGRAATGLVLVDTPAPRFVVEEGAGVFGATVTMLLDGNRDLAFDDSGWLAMGTYLRLLAQFGEPELDTPQLYLRASVPSGASRPWPEWELGGDRIDVDADHFGLINDPASAGVIEKWIQR